MKFHYTTEKVSAFLHPVATPGNIETLGDLHESEVGKFHFAKSVHDWFCRIKLGCAIPDGSLVERAARSFCEIVSS